MALWGPWAWEAALQCLALAGVKAVQGMLRLQLGFACGGTCFEGLIPACPAPHGLGWARARRCLPFLPQ